MYDATDEELIQRILPVLEIDHQYARHVGAWDQDLIAQVRRCGRTAARRLGYGVRTFQSDPDNQEDGRVVGRSQIGRAPPAEQAGGSRPSRAPGARCHATVTSVRRRSPRSYPRGSPVGRSPRAIDQT
jgi:hypothetical protein